MPQRNLLICFDAFGTLFKPRRPVEQQYAEVARSMGLTGFSDDELKASFRAGKSRSLIHRYLLHRYNPLMACLAFKKDSKENPNYGKATGMGPEKWWTSVIQNTFLPLAGKSNQQLPKDLVPTLLHRFWSKDGYMLFPDVQPLLSRLRNHYAANNGRMVIGVVTNSDDRVPDILSSLGVRVSSMRYGSSESIANSDSSYEIDFSVMSYDVGHEKPDKRIFAAAEKMLGIIIKEESSLSSADDSESWQKLYVGDEYSKDIVGAVGAGWDAILIDRESAEVHSDVTWLDDQPAGSLQDMFGSSKAVAFSSLSKLAEWLPNLANIR